MGASEREGHYPSIEPQDMRVCARTKYWPTTTKTEKARNLYASHTMCHVMWALISTIYYYYY